MRGFPRKLLSRSEARFLATYYRTVCWDKNRQMNAWATWGRIGTRSCCCNQVVLYTVTALHFVKYEEWATAAHICINARPLIHYSIILPNFCYRDPWKGILILSTHRRKPTGGVINTCNNMQASILASFCCIGKKSLNVKTLCCCKAPLSTRFIIYPPYFPLPLSPSDYGGPVTGASGTSQLLTCWWVCVSDPGRTHIRRSDVNNKCFPLQQRVVWPRSPKLHSVGGQ